MNTTCRICSSDRLRVFLRSTTTDPDDSFTLWRCDSCSFISILPVPNPETLKKYYNDDYWADEKSQRSNLLNILFKIRTKNIIREIKNSLAPAARILDWGAGDGSLIRLLKQNGFICYGIDLYSKSPSNEELINSSIEEAPFPSESFDAITCFHVLEHLENPVKSMKKAFELLKQGGTLILEVPNISSLGFSFFKRRWQPLELPTHLNHFNLKSLKHMCSKVGGYEIKKISHFSHRVSASSLVLSLFPFFSPKRVRKTHNSTYPKHIMGLYLLLQVLAYPFAILESLLRRGAVIRIFIIKL